MGVPYSSLLVVIHRWAPCPPVSIPHVLSVAGGNNRRVNVCGGIVYDHDELLGVLGLAQHRVLHLRARVSSEFISDVLSAVGGNNREVIVGVGIGAAPDLPLGSLVLRHSRCFTCGAVLVCIGCAGAIVCRWVQAGCKRGRGHSCCL